MYTAELISRFFDDINNGFLLFIFIFISFVLLRTIPPLDGKSTPESVNRRVVARCTGAQRVVLPFGHRISTGILRLSNLPTILSADKFGPTVIDKSQRIQSIGSSAQPRFKL